MMKNLVSIVCASGLMAMLLAVPACKSTSASGPGKITPERITAIAQLSSYVGGVAALSYKPESRPILTQIQANACLLSTTNYWDLHLVMQGMVTNQLGTEWMNSPEGKIITEGGILLVDSFTGGKFHLQAPDELAAFTAGVCRGLTAALSNTKARALRPHAGKDVGAPVAEDYHRFTQEAVRTRPN